MNFKQHYFFLALLLVGATSLSAMHPQGEQPVFPQGPVIMLTPYQACIKSAKQLDHSELKDRLKELEDVSSDDMLRNHLRELRTMVQDRKRLLEEESDRLANQIQVNPKDDSPYFVPGTICGALALACLCLSTVAADEECTEKNRDHARHVFLGGVGFSIASLCFFSQGDPVKDKKAHVDRSVAQADFIEKMLDKKLRELPGN